MDLANKLADRDAQVSKIVAKRFFKDGRLNFNNGTVQTALYRLIESDLIARAIELEDEEA